MTPLRRAAIALLAGIALLLAIDFGVWLWATDRMLTALAMWQAQSAAAGVRAETAPPRRAGWPLAATLVLPDVTAEFGPAGWRADFVRVSLAVWRPATLAVAARGAQSLRIAGLPPIGLTANSLTAAIPLGEQPRPVIEGAGIAVDFAGKHVAIGGLQAQMDAAGLDIAAWGVVVGGAGLPFGGLVERVAAHLHLIDPPERAHSLGAWARDGGRIALDRASLRWGPLDAQASGVGGLDAALQPEAQGSVHMTGYRDGIDAAVRAGVIAGRAGRVVGAMLDLMATGAPPAVDVPLSVHAGVLAMGDVPFARIAPLSWP